MRIAAGFNVIEIGNRLSIRHFLRSDPASRLQRRALTALQLLYAFSMPSLCFLYRRIEQVSNRYGACILGDQIQGEEHLPDLPRAEAATGVKSECWVNPPEKRQRAGRTPRPGGVGGVRALHEAGWTKVALDRFGSGLVKAFVD